MGFTPVEEAERILMVPLEMAEKEAKDFFREVRVEEPVKTMSMEDLVVVVALLAVVAAAAGILVEAVEEIVRTAVGEGEDLITPGQISKMTVVSTQLAMVR